MLKELRVGIITNSHGLNGEVKVLPTTDDVERFEYLNKCFVYFKNNKIELEIDKVKYLNKFVVLKFKNYNNIDDILKFKGKDLMISREDAVKLDNNENFIGDIIGCTVVDRQGVTYGKVKDVIFTGANDVYLVSDGSREFCIPVIPQCVLDVDVENEIITIELLKGLLD